jgi:hypothetical protein
VARLTTPANVEAVRVDAGAVLALAHVARLTTSTNVEADAGAVRAHVRRRM